MPEDLSARVAVHGSRLERLEDDLDNIRDDLRAINKSLQDIRDVLMQAKGGWKTLVMVGGIGGAVGAFLAKVLPFIPLK